MNILRIRDFFIGGSERTSKAKKNIIASVGLKFISIWISLQVVSLTLGYVSSVKFGIWLTLSSIIAWFAYFDFGFANGFRNRFAEARAKNQDELARCYVSTTYMALGLLFTSIFIILILINHYLIDWGNILNVDKNLNVELSDVFVILSFFFCCNIILNVVSTMFMADQKPAYAACLQTGGQIASFIVIYVMIQFTDGSLVNLALASSGIPCVLLLVSSIIIYHSTEYRKFSPSIKYIRLSLIKKVLGMGWKFFIILISILIIYQFVNIILSRIQGPVVVTQYNIAYKYFNVLNMVASIILVPFWSAFTDAYIKKDFLWMRTVQRNLEKMWLLCVLLAILMLVCSNTIFSWWIGDQIQIPFSLSLVITIYILLQTLVGVYVTLINGIGTVYIQLVIYLSFSIIALPLINWGCQKWGTTGALIIPIIVCVCQVVFGRIQILKLISGKAHGIWCK